MSILLLKNLELIQTLIALLGFIGAVISILYAARQLRDSKRSAQGNFLLRFDEMLDRHDAVHKRLRPGGDLASGETIAPGDWPAIERYMGLFERIKILIDDGFIDLDAFDRLYGYRIDNITNNKQIKQAKLVDRAYGWRDFNALVQDLERHRAQVKR
jgi:hypothetical protein